MAVSGAPLPAQQANGGDVKSSNVAFRGPSRFRMFAERVNERLIRGVGPIEDFPLDLGSAMPC